MICVQAGDSERIVDPVAGASIAAASLAANSSSGSFGLRGL